MDIDFKRSRSKTQHRDFELSDSMGRLYKGKSREPFSSFLYHVNAGLDRR